jgi:ATP-dependent DNA helicase RecQ
VSGSRGPVKLEEVHLQSCARSKYATDAACLTTDSNSNYLAGLLRSVFGFEGFRANQQEVCRAAIEQHDLLLVMPTGSGKSLCYQLPAIALGGTALVISPLIALMEDQAAKLRGLGLRVARIHSGLDRAASRQACQEYLRGNLQFLFIAPERLRVPGFPEMLAKRKPSLIAIDEAHCISQWGHDFRPDYRMLGQYLPELRPAPVLALTATATPTVQKDITTQLGMTAPKKFVHGFRRENLAIEVVEVPVPERSRVICALLARPERRPAIVYATSRKQAERLAEDLARTMPAATYHAGLAAETRERVQTAFLAGKLEAVVATIAFGMGIDKANIRTVIHAGLPGTLEGYYQEIGRAGRDGRPSRTILMHSYADQRTHDFFLARDYPPIENLKKVYGLLRQETRTIEDLRATSRLSEEEFEKALEKLEIHGGARVDFAGNASLGGIDWKKTYTVQAQHRGEQFEKVLRFTASGECRMAALVGHFGDAEDASLACGVCDVCDPGGAVLKLFRRASTTERKMARTIVEDLRSTSYKAAGTLQRSVDSSGHVSRGEFDKLLDAMTRAGLIEIEDAEYEKDGEVRQYRKVCATKAGLESGATDSVDLLIADGFVGENDGETKSTKSRSAPMRNEQRSRPRNVKDGKGKDADLPTCAPEAERLAAQLKAWRSGEAKRLGVPAYLVLNDRTLIRVANARPGTPNQLLAVDGIGPAKVEKFGQAILQLCSTVSD